MRLQESVVFMFVCVCVCVGCATWKAIDSRLDLELDKRCCVLVSAMYMYPAGHVNPFILTAK